MRKLLLSHALTPLFTYCARAQGPVLPFGADTE